MKTFQEFQESYRDPSARGGFDPRFDRKGKPDLGRGPNRWTIPDRSPTLGMDKMARTQYNAKKSSTPAVNVGEAKGDGASPYEVYKPKPTPTNTTPPPADFRDKYLPKQTKQAQLVPPKTNAPVDLRGPGEKLRALQILRKQQG
jgi:hypothetical protein